MILQFIIVFIYEYIHILYYATEAFIRHQDWTRFNGDDEGIKSGSALFSGRETALEILDL